MYQTGTVSFLVQSQVVDGRVHGRDIIPVDGEPSLADLEAIAESFAELPVGFKDVLIGQEEWQQERER